MAIILRISLSFGGDFSSVSVSVSVSVVAMASQWNISVKVITGQVTKVQALNGPVSWYLVH